MAASRAVREHRINWSAGPTGSGGGGGTFAEIIGGVTNIWSDYSEAGGHGRPEILSGTTVQVACWVTDVRVAGGNTYWNEIASSP
jgi:hypothetical protein